MVYECWHACATGKSHLKKKVCTCADVNVRFQKYMHCRSLFLYPIERDFVCVFVCVDVHVCMKERERENEGESGRKIGTEPESFFFFSSHQDDYSVLRNERALLKIFNFKEKFSVKAHPLLLSLVGRKAFNIT